MTPGRLEMPIDAGTGVADGSRRSLMCRQDNTQAKVRKHGETRNTHGEDPTDWRFENM